MLLFRSGGHKLKISLVFLLVFTFAICEVFYFALFPESNAHNSAWAKSTKSKSRKVKAKTTGEENQNSSKLEKKPVGVKNTQQNREQDDAGKGKITKSRKALQGENSSREKASAVKKEVVSVSSKKKRIVKSSPSKKNGKRLASGGTSGEKGTTRTDDNLKVSTPGIGFIWPVHGRIGSGYRVRKGSYGGSNARSHRGIDIVVPTGTPVMAAAEGTVILVGTMRGYGKTVKIAHDDNFITLYAHNSILLAREGKRVRGGEFIALSGKSGRSTAPHVHFEIRKNNRPVNPQPFLPKRG